ncbi:MAG: YceI family protein [Ignavibacteriales bacterium]|nr:YceI family protein [Ignavibacteriales bacterium]
MTNVQETTNTVETKNNWKIDTAHTNINFTVAHMVIAEVTGNFKEFEGTVTASKEDFSDAVVDVTIKAASINTENPDRDAHLRSADFFDAENHPVVTFKSTKTDLIGEGKLKISGDLSIRGITKQIVLDAKFKGKAVSPYGHMIAAFKASATIHRKEFGLQWNAALETGGFLVGEEIELTLNVEVVQ